MDSIVPYDAIVLQYGLNVMTPEILHYGSYARKMTEVVRHLRECYPHTDIILMGVGDRSRKANGAFVTMPAVVALSEAQRRAANGQANKDYTHINHKGGKRLATEFVKSLEYEMNREGL